MSRTILSAALVALLAALAPAADGPAGGALTVHKRSRDAAGAVQVAAETWEPRQTAIIVCDMWDAHHCLNAVRRATEMAGRMDQVLADARRRGALVIHAPSSCMDAYKGHPARRRA